MHLAALPAELLEIIFRELLPKDVLNVARACSTLNTHANRQLTRLAREQEHCDGYELTRGLQEVSFWYDRRASGSILEWAVVRGQLQTFLRLLADPGMDVIRADEYGVTMLHRICGSGHSDFVEPLLRRLRESQSTTSPADACSLTPLHYAAGRNKAKLVSLLIRTGADVNAKDNHGNTALHLAAVAGANDVMPLLVHAGADVHAETRFRWTPIDQASISKRNYAYCTSASKPRIARAELDVA